MFMNYDIVDVPNINKITMTTAEHKLSRSSDKVLGGVCAGIAKYFGWDPAITRLLYVIISVASAAFPGTLVYLILWMLLPKES